MTREYYSQRKGLIDNQDHVDFDILRRMFRSIFRDFEQKGYFQEYFGTNCVDGFIAGKVGSNISDYVYYKLKNDRLWPIPQLIDEYSENDIFSMIEFLYDHVSKGLQGYMHGFDNCGEHFEQFDKDLGKADLKMALNPVLKAYKGGYELNAAGEIDEIIGLPMKTLVEAKIVTSDHDNVTNKIDSAIAKFRRYDDGCQSKKEAIRELADVLEYLRPRAKKVISKKDDSALFQIANNFAIRHHNASQSNDYNKVVWYSWMFYFYLSSIHAILRFIKISESERTNIK